MISHWWFWFSFPWLVMLKGHFLLLLAIYISSLEKCLFSRVAFCLLLSSRRFLYILNINLLSVIWFVYIFPSLGSIFTLCSLIDESFNCGEVQFICFSHCLCFYVIIKKSLPKVVKKLSHTFSHKSFVFIL